MKFTSILICAMMLSGCASFDVAHTDQLILEVKPELLVKPEPLRKL